VACVLHLTTAALIDLGPYPYAMIAAFFVFVPREFWEWAKRRAAERRQSAELEFNPESGLAVTACRFVKRFDTLERIRFREQVELRSIAISIGGKRGQDLSALRLATAALPVPVFGAIALRLPGLTRFVRRQLQMPTRASGYFELDEVLGKDAWSQVPSAARVALGRWLCRGREGLVLLLMVVAVTQVLLDNHSVPEALRPTWRFYWMEELAVYPRMIQAWDLFTPSPPTQDGRLVVDATTKGGKDVDPLTGAAADFDVQPPGGFGMSQLTADFHRHLMDPGSKVYLDGLREYVKNYPLRTGNPDDEIVRFDIYAVEEQIPPPGQPHAPPTKRALLSFGPSRRH
jgi:hypothetical protein